jgi:hypothetical protein
MGNVDLLQWGGKGGHHSPRFCPVGAKRTRYRHKENNTNKGENDENK